MRLIAPPLYACLLLMLSSAATAQQTTQDPSVDRTHLGHMLLPLTQEDLVGEADAWRDLLKAKAGEISAAEIDLSRAKAGGEGAPSETPDALQSRLLELQDERTRLIDRVNTVIAALQGKGGEVESYKTYVGAVGSSLPSLDATDVSGLWQAVQHWLTSEEGGIRWGTNIVLFILTLLVFKIIAGVVASIVRRALAKFGGSSDLLRDFFANTVRKVVSFIGLVIALSMLEVDVTPFLAAIGAAGFVIGFALQGTLSNFASGIMILLYRPYDLGDFVTAGGVTGTVKAMSLVSTTITTGDNQRVIVPNGSIWGGVITNVTGNDTRRIDLVFGIGYEDDIEKAQSALEELVSKHELVMADPAPVIKLHELADSSVNFICRPWVKTSDYWAVYWDLTRAVKERFDKDGISIPFPQQDVHVHQVAG